MYHIDGLDRDRLTSLECIKTKTRPAAVANDDSPVSRKRALESEATEQSNSPGVSASKKKIVRQGRSPSESITCVPSTPSVALSKAAPSISQSGVGAGYITPVTTRAQQKEAMMEWLCTFLDNCHEHNKLPGLFCDVMRDALNAQIRQIKESRTKTSKTQKSAAVKRMFNTKPLTKDDFMNLERHVPEDHRIVKAARLLQDVMSLVPPADYNIDQLEGEAGCTKDTIRTIIVGVHVLLCRAMDFCIGDGNHKAPNDNKSARITACEEWHRIFSLMNT